MASPTRLWLLFFQVVNGLIDRIVTISDEQMNRLVKAATADGTKFNEKEYNRSQNYIRTQIKALVARRIFQKRLKADRTTSSSG